MVKVLAIGKMAQAFKQESSQRKLSLLFYVDWNLLCC